MTTVDPRPSAGTAPAFSVQAAHTVVKDLLRPNMTRYWVDFLLSMATAVLAYLAMGWTGYVSVLGIVCYLVAVLALFRAGMFIHEIIHFQGRRQFRAFRIGWNLLCGIPMMIPVFLYVCHGEHHNRRHYGSPRDAEYLPFATLPPSRIVGVIAASPLLPILAPYRFGILAPLGWLFPPLRRYVYQQASALKLDVDYVGRMPANRRERLSWMGQEAGCFAVVVTVAVLTATGYIAPARILEWYLVTAGIVTLNTVRFLGAHRYHGDDDGMSIEEQMLDTVNVPRRRYVTELWGPVGLRLHALHHLMPGLPYHAYQTAHERLIDAFGTDSPYASTSSTGLLASTLRVWRESRANHRSKR